MPKAKDSCPSCTLSKIRCHHRKRKCGTCNVLHYRGQKCDCYNRNDYAKSIPLNHNNKVMLSNV